MINGRVQAVKLSTQAGWASCPRDSAPEKPGRSALCREPQFVIVGSALSANGIPRSRHGPYGQAASPSFWAWPLFL